MRISPPASGSSTPVRIFINVLLPAPFSPASASTSPRAISSVTRFNARTPGNVFEMSRTSRNGVIGGLCRVAWRVVLTAWSDRAATRRSSFARLLGIAAEIVLCHHGHAGVDIVRLLLAALDLRNQMLDSQLAHRHGALHHDCLDRAIADTLHGVRQIFERNYFELPLHRAELFGVQHLCDRRPADLADTEDALQLRMRT